VRPHRDPGSVLTDGRRVGADLDLTGLLASAPRDDWMLLELALAWPALDAAQERIAAGLRLFVITRDPLGWIPARGEAWATSNADGDTFELPVYVLLEAVYHRGDEEDAIVSAISRIAARALVAAADAEALIVPGAHPGMVASGAATGLLDTPGGDPRLPGPPAITVRSGGWEPIGLGAIQDLVQDAFGPVDLDRSLVDLGASADMDAGCPACRGERFGFPADLETARASMCRPHRAAALAVSTARIDRARASNPPGWRAMGKASARINGLPEPGGLPVPARRTPSTGRNDPCPCGSGLKYKRCCGA
jgi:hypothetical protein